MASYRGLDFSAYVIPGTALILGNHTKMYMIFYSLELKCYFSVTLTSMGNQKPKTTDRWKQLQFPNGRWYSFDYKWMETATGSENPVEYIEKDWMPKKVAEKKNGKKLGWAPWEPSADHKQFIVAHIHLWLAQEKQVPGANTRCNAVPPDMQLSCEQKHSGSEWACLQDYADMGNNVCQPGGNGDDCLPLCFYDKASKVCKDLPKNDINRRRNAKYAVSHDEKAQRNTELDNIRKNSAVESYVTKPIERAASGFDSYVTKPIERVASYVVEKPVEYVTKPIEQVVSKVVVSPVRYAGSRVGKVTSDVGDLVSSVTSPIRPLASNVVSPVRRVASRVLSPVRPVVSTIGQIASDAVSIPKYKKIEFEEDDPLLD
jgi:hypothetical protein